MNGLSAWKKASGNSLASGLERMEESLREQFGVGVPLACFEGVVLEFPHIKLEALELFVSEARRQTGLGAGDDVAERTVRDA